MSGPKFIATSPEFVEGNGGTQTLVQREETRHGKGRWKILTPKTALYLTTAQAEALADALDEALDWYFDGGIPE